MNTLHLLRHAKSSAKENVEDHDRPLSRRGREAARLLGKYLAAKLDPGDLVLCSSARRTRETLELVVPESSSRPRIMIEDALYLASSAKLMARLRRLNSGDVNVLLIGHNPGLRDLAVALADHASPDFRAFASSKFPTAACASFAVVADWSALGYSRHKLTGYVTPASLSGGK